MRAFDRYAARTVRGTTLDERYVLGELLGSGGMARVFLAHDEALDRNVALKILWDQYADNEEFVERFKREARSAAALGHPNVVSVYDWGCSEDEMYYMAMEYASALYPKGPRSEQLVLLLIAELEYLGEADEEVHGYLSALARYDVFEEDRVVPGFLGQLRQAHTVLCEDAK